MFDDASGFLLGGGGKSAKFDTIGDTITGTLIDAKPTQQTDIGTGAPLTWDNGEPKMQLVVRLQTTERLDGDDDGIRSVYVKGSKKAGTKSLHDALASAVRNSGSRELEEGATLTFTYVGDEPSKTRGFNARKLYEATYVPPSKTAGADAFLGTLGATPVAASAPVATPAPVAPVATPAPQASQPALVTPPPPPGVDPQAWANYLASQRA